jgi:hypothetical protein
LAARRVWVHRTCTAQESGAWTGGRCRWPRLHGVRLHGRSAGTHRGRTLAPCW